MVSAGRICPLPKGDWDTLKTYDFLDFVNYDGTTYIAKRVTAGEEPPTNGEAWQLFAGSVASPMRYAGSMPFASLGSAEKTLGSVYNIEDAFTTDSTFKEGTGHGYSAGANVMWNGETWDVLSGNRDFATITVTLTVEGWTGSGEENNTAPWTQTVNDESLHDRTSLVVSTLNQNTPAENYKPYKKVFAMLLGATVGEGYATFSASAQPATEITVNIVQGA